jgi:predicted ATPase/DNA-binding CsgD family transcriptional regulator
VTQRDHRSVVTQLPPQITPFVGREREIAEVTGMLEKPECRLITLLGPGGIGKTRLAIACASNQRGHAQHQVYFVSLAPLRSADNILGTLADALSFKLYVNNDPKAQLFAYLADKCMLVIFDNFEHVLDGREFVSELLYMAPQLKIMTTSREALNLREEWIWEVPGLDVPDSDQPHEINHYSAVELFVQSARRASNTFDFEAEQASILRICQLAEGLPLAIELAASWLRVLTCEEIAEEMQHGVNFLVTTLRNLPARHQSMRAVFNHSWRLLSEEERLVFERLSVFRGGFRREAAAQIANASLQILGALVDKSLLKRSSSGRYFMHELLRQYGEEQLESSGRSKVTAAAHSHYYAAFLQQRIDDLKGRRQVEAIREIEADFENVRMGWNWASAHGDADVIEMALEGLDLFCTLRDFDRERAALLLYAQQCLVPPPEVIPHRVWGRLLARTAGNSPDMKAQLDTALTLARHYGDQQEIAYCLSQLSLVAYAAQEFAQVKELLDHSFAIYRETDAYRAGTVIFQLTTQDNHADIGVFRDRAKEGVRLTRELGDVVDMAMFIGALGMAEAELGRFDEAEKLLHERIRVCKEIGKPSGIALSLAHLSRLVYFVQGDFAKCRRVAEEALTLSINVNNLNGRGWALTALSLLAGVEEGDYPRARSLGDEAVSVSQSLRHIEHFASIGLAIAAYGLGEYQSACRYLIMALGNRGAKPSVVWLTLCLPTAAMMYAHRGYHERAVELLAFAFTHPVRATGWMERWQLLNQAMVALKSELGAGVYAAAWERGSTLLIEDVTAALLTQFRAWYAGDDSDIHITIPLTAREVEVLRLVAAGYQSQEIADTLVISYGTVKWYISQIFEKLGVHNRTQAVARAQQLKLLP